MSDSSPRPSGPDNAVPAQSLTDRVLARVNDAGRTERRRPKTNRRRREARSLRRVFLEMGEAYREFRGRTGAPISPHVRAAAYHFREEPNVDSLVSVAARLDELRVLSW